jgi:predicted HTH domain antitoxin
MWQLKQLEKLHEIEPDTVDAAITEFLNKEPVLREKLIIGAYIDGQINFGKAAELLGIHPVKLKEQFLSKGIPVRIGIETKEEMVAEGVAAKGIREDTK